jgi:hypothetical protein
MEILKDFFSKDNISSLFDKFYGWFEGILINAFGNFSYEPIRALLVNPWFWIILAALIFLWIIFRRR